MDDELVLHLRIAPSDRYLTLRGECTLRWDLGKTTTGEGDREVRIREADDSSFSRGIRAAVNVATPTT